MTKNIKDLVAQEVEAAEDAERLDDDNAPVPAHTKVTRGHSRTRTLQIRLNGDEYDELQRLAKARDLPISTVARSLLLTTIRPKDDLESSIERLDQALASVKRWLVQK